MSKYDKWMKTTPEAVNGMVAGAAKKGRKSDDRPILKAKEGFEYHLVLLPYVHGPEGHPPIIEVPMHYSFGWGFPCLKENGIDEKCAMDDFVQDLWAEWREYKKQENVAGIKATLAEINKCRVSTHYYSPVRVVNVVKTADGSVAEEELKKYKDRVVWWGYSSTAWTTLTKNYKEYGDLHNPFDPAILKLEMVKAQEEGRKASYPKPTIIVKQSRDKGAFAIVHSEEELDKLIESVPPVMEAGIFEVVSNEKMSALLRQNFAKEGGAITRKRRNNDADSFDPSELEGDSPEAAATAEGATGDDADAKKQYMDEIDGIFSEK